MRDLVQPRPRLAAAGCALVLAGVILTGDHVVHAGASSIAIAAPIAAKQPAACDVTHPNGRTPPGEGPSDSAHGEHGLWTALPLDGILRITTRTPVADGETAGTIRRDGSLSTKFPWWGSKAASAKLTIRGRRLDGDARPLRLTIGPGAVANSPHFWPSRLRFATPGCWKVTAKSRRAHLTFTVSVQSAQDTLRFWPLAPM
jgi:hypothetical protein